MLCLILGLLLPQARPEVLFLQQRVHLGQGIHRFLLEVQGRRGRLKFVLVGVVLPDFENVGLVSTLKNFFSL
jgi:hypothetical protein